MPPSPNAGRTPRLSRNERFTIYATKGSDFSGIPKVSFALCKPVQTGGEAVNVGGNDLAEPYLKNKDTKAFTKMFWPEIERMLNSRLDEKGVMIKESPILELSQSLSRVSDLTGRPFNRLVLISDLIQNADGVTFCYKPDQRVPAYQKLAASHHWRRLQPSSFSGVDVEVLMLLRDSQKLYCTADELEDFFREYFSKNGAKSFKAIRLREGA